MNLSDLQRNWDAFGQQDPFWAILTDPARRGNRWTPEEFFATGRTEVDELMARAGELGVPHTRRRALDFGCGAGRLTQALASHVDSVLGVDVAPSMVALARAHNRHGDRCSYAVNDQPTLGRWIDQSFDLIYTNRVLQHIEPRYTTSYLREFVRLLAPGGYLSFDLPSASGDAAAAADGAVPASAMRAHIAVTLSGTLAVAPGASLRVMLAVTNLSDRTWTDSSAHPLNLGNHWLDAAGALVRLDDVRVPLPAPLAPGQEVRVPMTVMAPTDPGVHRLQFDVVQEGMAWFASCGSTPCEVTLRVGAGDVADGTQASRPAAVPEDTTAFEPVMEMHAVPREEVESLLADAGARLLDVRRVHHGGPQWLAFRYDVTR